MPVFSLEEARALQVKNISQNTFKYWPESAVYGYFIGGGIPPFLVVSTVNRLEFSTDVISLPGKNLPTVAPLDGGFSNMDSFSNPNSSYGYLAGGSQGVPTSCVIRRLDFSNETLSLPAKNLPTVRITSRGINNNSYGYVVGGFVPAVYVCSIVRLDFSNETISLPGKDLPATRGDHAAIYDKLGLYGYFGGGYDPNSKISTIARLEFSTETTSLPAKNLSTARAPASGTSSISYGYIVGGDNSPLHISTISRLDFSTENISNLGNNLPSGLRSTSTQGISSNYFGYFGGGYAPLVSPGVTCSIFRIDFSTEMTSSPSIQLSIRTRSMSTLSGGQSIFRGSKTYGYMIGGFSPPHVNTVSRLDFSSEVISNPGKNLPAVRGRFSGATSSNYYGYFGGGYTPGTTRICTITRLDFSNETVSDPGKDLPTVNTNCGGVSSNNYGYFGGGYRFRSSPPVPALRLCTITRLDFSTENINNISGQLLEFGIDSMATVMNNSYGYFGGGLTVAPSTAVSNITRLDFSNETTSSPSTKLPINNYELAALSSSSYGYFGGGLGPTSLNTINRLDFSNDTLSPPGKNLPTARYRHSTVSSNFYGYFIGGWFPIVNTVSRIDFSNETMSLPGKDNLTHSQTQTK